MNEEVVKIIHGLNEKAALKQRIYKSGKEVFETFKKAAYDVVNEVTPKILKENQEVEPKVTEIGEFEFHLKFSGDTIVFLLHTNVFTFPPEHKINQSKYISQDNSRGYFCMIQVYNFLSDSIKYNRVQDVGYQLARVFVNADSHFYVDGQRQLGFLYQNIEKNALNEEAIEKIIEQCMLYSLEFDLFVPPVDTFKSITVQQKNYFNGVESIPTGKRVGFKIDI